MENKYIELIKIYIIYKQLISFLFFLQKKNDDDKLNNKIINEIFFFKL